MARSEQGRERYDSAEANATRNDRLLHTELRRRARQRGLELRHSDYGYSLIDAQRQRVAGRNDMTLAEVAKHLDATG
jgi:hypothetical protein